jgi:hypothetical protein
MFESINVYEGGLYIYGFIKKTTSYEIEKKMYLLYVFHPELHTHLWIRCSNFFNRSKKIYLFVLQIGK